MRAALFVASLAGLPCLMTTPAAAQETQDQFMARCTQVLAETANMASYAEGACAEQWPKVTRANQMVDAILSVFVAGTPSALDPADVQRRASMVRWTSPSQGRLADLNVETTRTPTTQIIFKWSATGEPVPFDPVEALRVRGASVDPIGCYAFGAGESNSVWRVEAPGHAPFALTVYNREAPTASAMSHITVSADAERNIPTLGDLRAAEPDPDWMQTCPR
ncbi:MULTISPECIES: hypothetical protein [unclassified Brevundimonas]|uniref:hypothetical protein n=1 Tax=unclassified Brevundimonas TaxID=2622653 RepID=UPI0025BDE081|nr:MULTISPECIES: hypothetical protein [unclassified Brevundimonas]